MPFGCSDVGVMQTNRQIVWIGRQVDVDIDVDVNIDMHMVVVIMGTQMLYLISRGELSRLWSRSSTPSTALQCAFLFGQLIGSLSLSEHLPALLLSSGKGKAASLHAKLIH